MNFISVSLFLIHSTNIIADNVKYYITPNGSDTELCGDSIPTACGTIGYVTLEIVTNQNVINDSFEMYILGQNYNLLNADAYAYCAGDHSLWTGFYTKFSPPRQLTITFDPDHIQHLSDWYNKTYCDYGYRKRTLSDPMRAEFQRYLFSAGKVDRIDNMVLTINNLIFDNYEFASDDELFGIASAYSGNIRFVFNNCTFKNITVDNLNQIMDDIDDINDDHPYRAVFHAYNIKFTNCAFEDISIIDSGTLYDGTFQINIAFINFEQLTSNVNMFGSNINIDHCYFNNLFSVNAFIYVDSAPTEEISSELVLKNNTVNNISTLRSFIQIYNEIYVTTVTIQYSVFSNIQLGMLIYSFGSNRVFLSDLTITTPQLSKDIAMNTTIDFPDVYHLLYFWHAYQTVDIRNVSMVILFNDHLSENCADVYTSGWETFHGSYALMVIDCQPPIGFLVSDSIITIDSLHIYNDLEYEILSDYSNMLISSDWYLNWFYDNISISYQYIYPSFAEEASYFGFIVNQKQMNITNLYIHGAGAHEQIIWSGADLYIENVYADYKYYHNSFDKHGIPFVTFLSVSAGSDSSAEVIMNNAHIYGGQYGVRAAAGTVKITNSTFEYMHVAILEWNNVEEFVIDRCKFERIGVYYFVPKNMENLILSNFKHTFSAMVIAGMRTIIKDSHFSFYNPHGYIIADTDWIWKLENQNSVLEIVGNTFEINFDGVLYTPFFNQYISWWNDFDWTTVGWKALWYSPSDPFFTFGLIVAETNTHLSFIGNTFNGNYLTSNSQLNTPLLYIDNEANDNCFGGNNISTFAFHLKTGYFGSCKRPNAINYFDINACSDTGFGFVEDNVIRSYLQMYGEIGHFYNDLDSMEEVNIFSLEPDTFLVVDSAEFYITNKDALLTNTINSNILILDSIIEMNLSTTSAHLSFNPNNCIIYCANFISCDVNDKYCSIQQFNIRCNGSGTNTTENGLSVLISEKVQFVDYYTPHSIILEPADNYSPGTLLTVEYIILDFTGTEITDEFSGNIEMNLFSTNLSFVSTLNIKHINDDNICIGCDNIYIQSITIDMYRQLFWIETSVADNLLKSYPFSINVTNCESGYGVTGISKQCTLCTKGSVNVYNNYNDSCFICDNDLEGIACLGGNDILINHNYWISMSKYDNSNEVYASLICPSQACCQHINGCNYVTDFEYGLCAKNRDPKTYICGSCLNGYSEVYGTTACDTCDRNYWERFLLPIVYGLLWSVYIIYSRSYKIIENIAVDIKKQKQAFNSDIMSSDEYKQSMKVMLSKVLIYYYQCVSYILISSGIKLTMIGFVDLFNLNLFSIINNINSDSDSQGFCILQNMNAVQKVSLPITTTLSIIFFVGIAYLLSKCSIDMFKCCNRRSNFAQSFITTFLICIGQFLSVLFQLLACRDIGEISIHFFFGTHECFGYIWIISLISLCVMILAFLSLFAVILMDDDKKQSNQELNNYYPIIYCYRQQVWYWEFISFIRRLTIALVFIVFNNYKVQITVAIVLMLYLFIHLKCAPFEWSYVNKLESYLIASLIIIIFVKTNVSDAIFVNAIISTLIICPLIWYLYFIISKCKSLKNISPNNGNVGSNIEMSGLNSTDRNDKHNSIAVDGTKLYYHSNSESYSLPKRQSTKL